MDRAQLPLNALRAFEAAARHLNFTRAGLELCVSQSAISHQVSLLEERLGVPLFRRLPRGLALTDEGQALVPVIADSFDRIGSTLDRYSDGRLREVLTIGVIGTFAFGWLLPCLDQFTAAHPGVDLRLLTHNNRVDLAGEGLDLAIRFGDGAWHGTHATRIMGAPLSPLCSPRIAERLTRPVSLVGEVLLRSYRASEWGRWFDETDTPVPPLRGPMFDSSIAMIEAARAGLGVALAPPSMFARDLLAGSLVQPFATSVDVGSYWLTRLHSRQLSFSMRQFADWLIAKSRRETAWQSTNGHLAFDESDA